MHYLRECAHQSITIQLGTWMRSVSLDFTQLWYEIVDCFPDCLKLSRHCETKIVVVSCIIVEMHGNLEVLYICCILCR